MAENIDRLTEDVAGMLAEYKRKKAKERALRRRAEELQEDQRRIKAAMGEEIPVMVLS